MTLLVSIYWRDRETGRMESLTDWNDGHHMAGPEAARESVWGSEIVRRQGATFLPQLASSNLWVAPDELDAFEEEVRHLLANVDELRRELGRGPECLLPHYLGNFIRAADAARARGGGVSID
ncbi:hypothetical protein VT03_27900 [Planctomyces sp. SH-PL14]|nr:hypothetical protein VT03_27900 [Planctomyces sp. SH-PL14]